MPITRNPFSSCGAITNLSEVGAHRLYQLPVPYLRTNNSFPSGEQIASYQYAGGAGILIVANSCLRAAEGFFTKNHLPLGAQTSPRPSVINFGFRASESSLKTIGIFRMSCSRAWYKISPVKAEIETDTTDLPESLISNIFSSFNRYTLTVPTFRFSIDM